MQPAGVFYVLCLGIVLAVTAQDCPVPPKPPNTLLVFEDSQKTTFPDGSTATFECATGYVSAGGSRRITCTAGVWSPVTLECTRRNCGSPGEVENGYFEITGTLFGDKVVATCNTGYSLVGRRDMTCGVQGWMGRVPTCEVESCRPPRKVENASAPNPDKEIYTYGEVVRWKCLTGYTPNGSLSVSCSDNGKFTPDPPTCIKVQCKTPNIANANREGGGAPPYGYKAFVRYQCDRGYTMKGEAAVTCEINSQWSPALPECIAITTTTKATTTTTTTTRPPNAKTEPPSDRSTPPIHPKNDGHHWSKSWWFILVCVGLGGGTASCCVWCLCCKKKKSMRSDYSKAEAEEGAVMMH